MKTGIYSELKKKLTELNDLNDKINLIEWNNDEGPKFSSVEEMREFENKVINGELDFLFNDDMATKGSEMIDTYKITKDDFLFYIYSFKSNNDYITYMTIKNLQDDDVLEHLYGNKTNTKESTLSYFNKLKSDITGNSLDYIFKNILIDIENNINRLKLKYLELTSES